MPENVRYRFFFKGKSYLIPKGYIDHEHPGGGDEIMPYLGKDMTDAFEDADHSITAVEMLEEWLEEEYDPSIPSGPSGAPSPSHEGAKTAESATEVSPLGAAFASAAPKPAPTVSTEPKTTTPRSASEPSKLKSRMPSVATAAAVAVLMASIALVYLRVPKR
ncbi:putative Cytochrome b5-like Heme/Steroid binding domain containing protein [Leishmania utingensis]|uniref:Cytochrome b5-like Heme/Steroid binding domain containing protein n=1 Tax=Leishmania utingensis TaxID=653362 RepID=A0AAW3A3V2_9TRYP